MTVTVTDVIAQILEDYHKKSGEKHFEIAIDMDIPISNYRLYLQGIGNPTGKTIDKIVAVIGKNAPEILEKWGLLYAR